VALPQYSLGADTSFCHKETLILKANVPNTSVLWSDRSKQKTFNVTKDGVYWAEVATKEGCKFRDSIVIVVNNCTPFSVFVPNVFSPNGDGVNDKVKPFFNDEFEVVGQYSFQIFTRWGELVFATTDKNGAWDGTVRNQTIDNDVFVYVVQVIYQDFKGVQQKTKLSGDVTLVR
jgi:gliding motility-associated-like protein